MKSILDTSKLRIELSIGKEIYYKLKNKNSERKYNHYKAEMRGDKISNRVMIKKECYNRIVNN